MACINGPDGAPSPEFSTTPALTLVYDIMPPVLVTSTTQLSRTPLRPGTTLLLTYSEDLLCTRPYGFTIELLQMTSVGNVTTTEALYSAASLLPSKFLPLTCAGNSIMLQVPVAIAQRLALPATVGLRLAGVMDLYLNTDPAPEGMTIPLTIGA